MWLAKAVNQQFHNNYMIDVNLIQQLSKVLVSYGDSVNIDDQCQKMRLIEIMLHRNSVPFFNDLEIV